MCKVPITIKSSIKSDSVVKCSMDTQQKKCVSSSYYKILHLSWLDKNVLCIKHIYTPNSCCKVDTRLIYQTKMDFVRAQGFFINTIPFLVMISILEIPILNPIVCRFLF